MPFPQKFTGLALVALLITGAISLPPLAGLAQAVPDRNLEADRLLQQGMMQYQTGQFETAFESWQTALKLYRNLQNQRGEGAALVQLGLGYEALGDNDRAIEYLSQLLAYAQKNSDPMGEGFALSRLGTVYQAMGQYDKAVELHQRSLAIARQLKNQGGEGQELRNLGLAYLAQEDHARAVSVFQQTLAFARQLQDPQLEGIALVDLGLAYAGQGNRTKARESLQQGLAIVRKIQDRQGEISALGNLALVYSAEKNYPQAIDLHRQSLAVARETKDLYAEGIALNNIGWTQFQAGQLQAAEQTLQTCIQVLERLRAGVGNNDAARVSIFDQQLRVYRTLQQVLVGQQKIEPALEISELGRARAFVELLSSRLVSSSGSGLPVQPTSAPTIKQIKQLARSRRATLVQYSVIYDQFQTGQKQEWKETQLYIWVVDPEGKVSFRTVDLKPLGQPQGSSLNHLVASSRQTLGVRSRDQRSDIIVSLSPAAQQRQQQQQTRTLRQLHQLLIAPIADLLPRDPSQSVIFIPQQALFLVPFPALQDPRGQYLIENHTILTAPSIQVLQLTRQQRLARANWSTSQGSAGTTALIVGNPTMPRVSLESGQSATPLTPLPGAEAEARAIAPLFNTTPLIGSQGTETTVVQQMPQARVIHLATHGLLDDSRGLGSALALTPATPGFTPATASQQPDEPLRSDDGLLTAAEILELQLQAELVVLSACDTGGGRITGDGVIGLSRSFISAGVPSVIVSLWAVPDAPTAGLMQEFYQNWQNRQMDKAQALRQAMLTTMKTHPNPRDWAAFSLIGEAE